MAMVLNLPTGKVPFDAQPNELQNCFQMRPAGRSANGVRSHQGVKMQRRSALGYLVFAPMGVTVCQVVAAKMLDPAWWIEGSWLVSLEGDSRDRFLTVSGARLKGDSIEVTNTSYGFIDGSAKSVRQWQATVEGDSIRIQFLTPSDAQISVELHADEAAVLGQFKSSKGKLVPVRLTKLPASELAELRQASKATARLAAGVIRGHSRIVLLYVGASDCPACVGYQADYFGRKNLMAVNLPEFPEIIYQKASLGSYRATSSVASVLPPELAPLALRGPNGEPPKIRCHGTPYFALIVDDKLIVQAHGTSGLETLVLPQIKQALAQRRQAT